MAMRIHRSSERGQSKAPWLRSFHSFSFNEYYNENRLGFGKLVVFNEDYIAGKGGFGFHSHKNMEIVTLILSGELTHEDSMGNKGVIGAGEVQHMTAGTGVKHAEFNNTNVPVHLFQIWIEPQIMSLAPRYHQGKVELRKNELTVLAAPQDGIVLLRQKARILRGTFDAGKSVDLSAQNGSAFFVFVVDGSVALEGETAGTGDSIESVDSLSLRFVTDGDIVVIEVPFK